MFQSVFIFLLNYKKEKLSKFGRKISQSAEAAANKMEWNGNETKLKKSKNNRTLKEG